MDYLKRPHTINVKKHVMPKLRQILQTATLAIGLTLAGWFAVPLSAHSKDLPPLPIPTEEQLQKGRALLEKIAFVMENIPLTDEVAVMKEFGFIDLYSRDYPTHRDVGPKGKGGWNTVPAELAGTGFASIRLQPWVKSPRVNRTAMLGGRIAVDEVCISLNDVKRKFSLLANKTVVTPVIYSHPVPEPKPLNDVPSLSFEGLPSKFAPISGASFTFENQTCATYFGFIYQAN